MQNPYLAHQSNKTARRQAIHISKKPKPNIQLHTKQAHTVHGNYTGYYGYRTESRIDDRIKLFKKEWFRGRVLDIGCNSGLITLNIARLFSPVYVQGIDIDVQLIKKARWNQSIYRSQVFENDLEYFPVSCQQQLGAMPFDYQFSNVYFRAGEFLHEPDQERFDTILALSITKWIHLNNGDGGIRYFFNKIYKSLNRGGIFILEPQPFEGYRKRAGMTPQMRTNYMEIDFYPKDFMKFLVQKVGFTLLETLKPISTSKGFTRTIYVFQK
jgi:7SK snRNA methylphosphate capping enzyme